MTSAFASTLTRAGPFPAENSRSRPWTFDSEPPTRPGNRVSREKATCTALMVGAYLSADPKPGDPAASIRSAEPPRRGRRLLRLGLAGARVARADAPAGDDDVGDRRRRVVDRLRRRRLSAYGDLTGGGRARAHPLVVRAERDLHRTGDVRGRVVGDGACRLLDAGAPRPGARRRCPPLPVPRARLVLHVTAPEDRGSHGARRCLPTLGEHGRAVPAVQSVMGLRGRAQLQDGVLPETRRRHRSRRDRPPLRPAAAVRLPAAGGAGGSLRSISAHRPLAARTAGGRSPAPLARVAWLHQ